MNYLILFVRLKLLQIALKSQKWWRKTSIGREERWGRADSQQLKPIQTMWYCLYFHQGVKATIPLGATWVWLQKELSICRLTCQAVQLYSIKNIFTGHTLEKMDGGYIHFLFIFSKTFPHNISPLFSQTWRLVFAFLLYVVLRIFGKKKKNKHTILRLLLKVVNLISTHSLCSNFIMLPKWTYRNITHVYGDMYPTLCDSVCIHIIL